MKLRYLSGAAFVAAAFAASAAQAQTKTIAIDGSISLRSWAFLHRGGHCCGGRFDFSFRRGLIFGGRAPSVAFGVASPLSG